ncbi:UDP-N-acetylmuramate dehydrogenase [Nitrosovibrio sp. Nv4]|uniref:UDP-N-acetylmuramate dehydrogenase n=1 Tax=Nitrosovibrio sp. Nv4 TaxID=1945880 RepID=UPI000BC610A3|nr:UDP-N-acetylmuramate dehydrogenase [Nitrosovibrio sp. Nv4]SOD39940.1 UDP-N-acetylmuramate dehydrogenase [Nitrosovibrio sp. Nv4]
MDMSEIALTHGLHSLRGEMHVNQPMQKYTSWRAGGAAERVYLPAGLADLAGFLRSLPEDEPVQVVGLGSNLLVRDGGVRGTVVILHARLNDLLLAQQDKGEGGALVYAGAGVACAKVARFAAMHGMAGAEFLAGIPGTVGGALAMNAGCYGAETWEIAERVQTLDRAGKLRERGIGDYEIGYRHVKLKAEARARAEEKKTGNFPNEEWFVGGYFKLKSGDEAESRQKIKDLLARRINSQPLNLPNAGSVFRNPPGDWAARLIESCGLKGLRIGGAMVSPKHANFIVNIGAATAADIEAVIMAVRKTVKEQTGVELQPEVRIIGVAREPGQG